MSSGAMKDLKRQLRNVVQDELPTLVKSELYKDIEKTLSKQVQTTLTRIQDEIRANLEVIDQRSKDMRQFFMNQIAQQGAAANPGVPMPEDATPETPASG